MSNTKIIVLKSSDEETFEIEEAVALQSQVIAHMVEDDYVKNGIPLSNVTGEILAKIIEYCKKRVEGGGSVEELKTWDQEFIKDIDQSTLFNLIVAANYLNIKTLLDLTCQTVADMLKGKTPKQIRVTFNIKNDFTPEEKIEILEENLWAFD